MVNISELQKIMQQLNFHSPETGPAFIAMDKYNILLESQLYTQSFYLIF